MLATLSTELITAGKIPIRIECDLKEKEFMTDHCDAAVPYP
jgi:hypothetical protein